MRLMLIAATILLSANRLVAQTTQPAVTHFEQDRSAILAMGGQFDVTYQFQETVALKAGYKPHESDETAARELVAVIVDEGPRIELQHLLIEPGGSVIKHWRQQWLYENRDLLEYAGPGHWHKRQITAAEASGTWTQRVSNVDDSPRYEGFGRWEHGGNWTAWESNETWRPLPRREYTHRKDYQVIIGRNRHLLTPTGWVHEQDNEKVVLDAEGKPVETLVLERGQNTYTRSSEAKAFTVATDYWKLHAPFWTEVRACWTEARSAKSDLRLRSKVDGKPLYEALGELDRSKTTGEFDAGQKRDEIRKVIARFTQPAGEVSAR